MNHEARLRHMVQSDEWLMDVLRAARDVRPQDWAVTSGVIRNLVWDHLHTYEKRTPVNDVDVAFFDPNDRSRARDAALERALQERLPATPWEVTNQAGVHLWYETKFGHPIPPISSLEDGIERNPETATSVGVRLEDDDGITVIAPLGLDDLFNLTLRRNPRQVSREYFEQRLREKRITELWPKVSVISG